MFSPYEELEFLADHLPAEGEAVLVIREHGELLCRPWERGDLREGVYDADLYGCLVQGNERLNAAGSLPLWIGLLSLVWLTIGLHGLAGLDWNYWYLVPGVVPCVLFGCFHWIRQRQSKVFFKEVLPAIRAQIQRRKISPQSVISGVRQHSELRTLLDELVRWSPVPDGASPTRYRTDTLH